MITQIHVQLQKSNYQNKEEISHPMENDLVEFKGIIMGILADDEVNYKEAYELLY